MACLVRGCHHVLQHLDWLGHRAALGSRCAGRGVLGHQCTGSFLDVIGRVLGQSLACVRTFAVAGIGQCAVRIDSALHAQAGQNLLAHAEVRFHVGHDHTAQLVVDLVDVLWAEALGQRNNFRVGHVLLLAQQALKEVLALLLSSHEGLFDWFACLGREGIKQGGELLLVLVDTCLDGLELLGAKLLQQLCFAAEQGAVHGALGDVEHEACFRDPRIGQRGLQLLEGLLSFGAFVDRAKHLRQLAFSTLDQHVGNDVHNGQAVALGQTSDRFFLDVTKTALCALDFVHGPASSFDAGQTSSGQRQAHESGSGQEVLIQVLVWVGLVHVLFDGLTQALVACTESNVSGSSGHGAFLCVLDGAVGDRLQGTCAGLGDLGHRSGLCSKGQQTSKGQRAANTFAYGAAVALCCVDRSALAFVEELGQRGDLLLFHAQALTDLLGDEVRQSEQGAVEAPREVVDQALRGLAVRSRHLKARGPRISLLGYSRRALGAANDLPRQHVNNFSLGVGQRRHYWFRARS